MFCKLKTSSRFYRYFVLFSACLTMFLRSVFIFGTLPVLSNYYDAQFDNRKLSSKSWLGHAFTFVTAYFHEKKKRKSVKGFLRKKYFCCFGPKSTHLFLLILSIIRFFQNKQNIKMISKHNCLTLCKKSKNSNEGCSRKIKKSSFLAQKCPIFLILSII